MEHFYRDVPGLGNVAVSRHAQEQMQKGDISESLFQKVLLSPTGSDIPDGQDVIWREREGIRIVILIDPTPNRGAKLVKTVYRVQQQASAHR
ncbi:MAG: hypothetical protein A3A96_01850 [Candidatus Zambryskibacteria bacterium RIFCSPLOWO2_01_FULL_39_39]|uniref:DUF4258 domain-containing protein n=1 Tax=Candidatus Zambryskibacteria bacterium RIFCSPLOWO2_01_FULL_39_39 TaxID=1802758 RepID=A0A1G2TVU3_9BACT|nr:MAG: hypothetical protein UT00_C0005G0018 [Parcubacteria group bacterium GW2011_GWA1_38_7]OHA86595.1 MAG: hypothetical protein A2644_01965 [Candidatus Zambryskibacteria bacterium RIFCSPHIGHO2_01_FULL_39_63]OHA94236.1 MAG: hypothetical protein A3B88_03750 [Candidatus Zambryskibacteria bacterium RIFCSPHIGHO2_02_FULL_39_19]OHA98497.1 MAG: hypothetical protein A3F20_03745 [Candidatus Zambryskibacteria bacterium RIFCSPHIGHO2_12_FULL_39_21]OHB01416.1 MAG: hypothetical protein A3A96_01850 [Candidat